MIVAILGFAFAVPEGASLPALLEPHRAADPPGHADAHLWDLASRLAAAAVQRGCSLGERAGLSREEGGILLSTRTASLPSMVAFYDRLLKRGPRLASPLKFVQTGLNTPTGIGALVTGMQGPNLTLSTGAAAAGNALVTAIDMLRLGQAPWLIAGGVESANEIPAALRTALGLPADQPDLAATVVLAAGRQSEGLPCLGHLLSAEVGPASRLLAMINPEIPLFVSSATTWGGPSLAAIPDLVSTLAVDAAEPLRYLLTGDDDSACLFLLQRNMSAWR